MTKHYNHTTKPAIKGIFTDLALEQISTDHHSGTQKIYGKSTIRIFLTNYKVLKINLQLYIRG